VIDNELFVDPRTPAPATAAAATQQDAAGLCLFLIVWHAPRPFYNQYTGQLMLASIHGYDVEDFVGVKIILYASTLCSGDARVLLKSSYCNTKQMQLF